MSKAQVLDKGIRQKSTKRVNSFIVCSAFCPGPPNRDPMDSEKRLRVYKSGATLARHVWRVDKSPGHPRRNRNACLKVLRLSMGKISACIYGLRSELVKIVHQPININRMFLKIICGLHIKLIFKSGHKQKQKYNVTVKRRRFQLILNWICLPLFTKTLIL